MTQYVVLGEHTLGYIHAKQPDYLAVLAGKPQLGGHNPMNGQVFLGGDPDIRPATVVDFEFFRVCPLGHIVDKKNKSDFRVDG